MSLLLDTHVLIWIFDGGASLSQRVRDRLVDGEELFVSFASAWEYSTKRKKWPRDYPIPFDVLIDGAPYRHLDCKVAIGNYAETLPPIHKDPFDRMLIAQAITERMTLITSDTDMHKYPVDTFW